MHYIRTEISFCKIYTVFVGNLFYRLATGGPLGAGAGIYFGNLAEDRSIPLGKNVTVFQAETYAIKQCVSTLKSISVTGELITACTVVQAVV